VSQRHVFDVAQRAHLSVENEVPARKDHLFHVFARMPCALGFLGANPVIRSRLAANKESVCRLTC
jgi:hypothetical protein